MQRGYVVLVVAALLGLLLVGCGDVRDGAELVGDRGPQGERGSMGPRGLPGTRAPHLVFHVERAYAIAENAGDRMQPVRGCDDGTPIAGGCYFQDITEQDAWAEIESVDTDDEPGLEVLRGFACGGVAEEPGARVDVWVQCATEEP